MPKSAVLQRERRIRRADSQQTVMQKLRLTYILFYTQNGGGRKIGSAFSQACALFLRLGFIHNGLRWRALPSQRQEAFHGRAVERVEITYLCSSSDSAHFTSNAPLLSSSRRARLDRCLANLRRKFAKHPRKNAPRPHLQSCGPRNCHAPH